MKQPGRLIYRSQLIESPQRASVHLLSMCIATSSFPSPYRLGSCWAQKSEGERERKCGNGMWENVSGRAAASLSGLVSPLVPEDTLSDQRRQASGWQDVTLWQGDVHIEQPSTMGETYCLFGLKRIKPDRKRTCDIYQYRTILIITYRFQLSRLNAPAICRPL